MIWTRDVPSPPTKPLQVSQLNDRDLISVNMSSQSYFAKKMRSIDKIAYIWTQ